jgi:hypothetical protein
MHAYIKIIIYNIMMKHTCTLIQQMHTIIIMDVHKNVIKYC